MLCNNNMSLKLFIMHLATFVLVENLDVTVYTQPLGIIHVQSNAFIIVTNPLAASKVWLGFNHHPAGSPFEIEGCHSSYTDAPLVSCVYDGSSYTFKRRPKYEPDPSIYGGLFIRTTATVNGNLEESKYIIDFIFPGMTVFYMVGDDRIITASIGDDFTLETVEGYCYQCPPFPTNTLKWRHNRTEWRPEWAGNFTKEVKRTRLEDSGVYDLIQHGKQEYERTTFQVIVRVCPKAKYGFPDCLDDCPICHHSGECDPMTGLCICASGYRGENCEIPCAKNKFGQSCTQVCSGVDCSGYYLCPPSPQRCQCGSGYMSETCDFACNYPYYGPSCTMPSHCNYYSWDPYHGCSGQCHNAFSGSRCLVLKWSYHCSKISLKLKNFFGAGCDKKCHCKPEKQCSRSTGSCQGDPCADGWGGADCQIALPALYDAPKFSDAMQSSSMSPLFYNLTVYWSQWMFGHDYGNLGEQPCYGLKITEVGTTLSTIVNTTHIQLTIQLNMFSVLYEINVVVYRTVENSIVPGVPSPSAYTEITCPELKNVSGLTVGEYLNKLEINWDHHAWYDLRGCTIQYQVTYTLVKLVSSETTNSMTITINGTSLEVTDVVPKRKYEIYLRAMSNGNFGPQVQKTVQTIKHSPVSEVAYVYMLTPLFLVVVMMTISYRPTT